MSDTRGYPDTRILHRIRIQPYQAIFCSKKLIKQLEYGLPVQKYPNPSRIKPPTPKLDGNVTKIELRRCRYEAFLTNSHIKVLLYILIRVLKLEISNLYILLILIIHI